MLWKLAKACTSLRLGQAAGQAALAALHSLVVGRATTTKHLQLAGAANAAVLGGVANRVAGVLVAVNLQEADKRRGQSVAPNCQYYRLW